MTAPADTSFAPETHMGRLELRVRDMGTQLDYYTSGIGLVPLSEEPGAITLGHQGTPIVRLTESKDLRPASPGSAGLFHTAVLYAQAPDLARTLVSMYRNFGDTHVGTGDHDVSQAFYFTDPEGNGVELYVDRPRDQWTWNGDTVYMTTRYLDPVDFVNTHLSGTDPDAMGEASASLGHVHLQVGDVETARQFYVNSLGFDETTTLGDQALFVSAGGYHHHMAMNVWNSRGAGPRAKTLGMGVVDIVVPTQNELDRTRDRLVTSGHQTTFDGQTLSVLDPWHNEIRLSVG